MEHGRKHHYGMYPPAHHSQTKAFGRQEQCPEYICVLDLEASCWTKKDRPEGAEQEVIQLPSVLLKVNYLRGESKDATGSPPSSSSSSSSSSSAAAAALASDESSAPLGIATVSEFNQYVKPAVHPTLVPYCRHLCHVRQEQVDCAPGLEEALTRHRAWLAQQVLLPRHDSSTGGSSISSGSAQAPSSPEAVDGQLARRVLLLTCGDWDLGRQLPEELARHGLALPRYFWRWCNLQRDFTSYEQFLQAKRKNTGASVDAFFSSSSGSRSTSSSSGGGLSKSRKDGPHRVGMHAMLQRLGMEFEGPQHDGIVDCRNIGRIVQRMAADGYVPQPTCYTTFSFEGQRTVGTSAATEGESSSSSAAALRTNEAHNVAGSSSTSSAASAAAIGLSEEPVASALSISADKPQMRAGGKRKRQPENPDTP